MIRFVRNTFFILILFANHLRIGAQHKTENSKNVFGDKRIDSFRKTLPFAQLIMHYPSGFPAYRIQVISTNKKEKAQAISQDMNLLAPNLKVRIIYREPYYRVRVGVFKSEEEAEPYRKKIDNYYKKQFSVITLPEIIPVKECLENFIKNTTYEDFFKPLPAIDTSGELFIY